MSSGIVYSSGQEKEFKLNNVKSKFKNDQGNK